MGRLRVVKGPFKLDDEGVELGPPGASVRGVIFGPVFGPVRPRLLGPLRFPPVGPKGVKANRGAVFGPFSP